MAEFVEHRNRRLEVAARAAFKGWHRFLLSAIGERGGECGEADPVAGGERGVADVLGEQGFADAGHRRHRAGASASGARAAHRRRGARRRAAAPRDRFLGGRTITSVSDGNVQLGRFGVGQRIGQRQDTIFCSGRTGAHSRGCTRIWRAEIEQRRMETDRVRRAVR